MAGEVRPSFTRVISHEFSKAEWQPVKKSRSSRRSRTRLSEEGSEEVDGNGEEAFSDESADEGAPESPSGAGVPDSCSRRVFVDSSGDEFYSAEEFLVTSDEDEADDTFPDYPGSHVRPGRSRRQKRRLRQERRASEREFFAAFADGAGVSSSLADEGHELIDDQTDTQIAVPSLAELCISAIWGEETRGSLAETAANTSRSPTFHTMLKAGKERLPKGQLSRQMHAQRHRLHAVQLVNTVQLRWLQYSLLQVEQEDQDPSTWMALASKAVAVKTASQPTSQTHGKGKQSRKASTPVKRVYAPGWCFPAQPHSRWTALPERGHSDLHLAYTWQEASYTFLPKLEAVESHRSHTNNLSAGFMQLVNLALPLHLASSPFQEQGRYVAAVWRLWKALKCRLPKCTRTLLDMSLPYVWWARGLIDEAAKAFVAAAESANSDEIKVFYLNEVARMYLYTGNRSKASQFYRLANEVEDRHHLPYWAVASPLLLIAMTWDQGLLTSGTCFQAHSAWMQALRIAMSNGPKLPQAVYATAADSLLCFHTMQPFADGRSQSTEEISSKEWLTSVREWLESQVDLSPWLTHHLAIVCALLGDSRSSQSACYEFLALTWVHEWTSYNNAPADEPNRIVARQQLGNRGRFENLSRVAVLPSGEVPFLKMVWRTVLRPQSLASCMASKKLLGSIQSVDICLRFATNDLLTADVRLEFPPMRAIFLNAYTGEVCFGPSLPAPQPWLSIPDLGKSDHIPRYYHGLFPHLRAVLRRSAGVSVDLMHGLMKPEGSTAAASCSEVVMLLWQNTESGETAQLDIRRALRHELQKRLLENFEGKDADKAREVIDFCSSKGAFCSFKFAKLGVKPSSHEVRDLLFLWSVSAIFSFGEATVVIVLTTSGTKEKLIMVVDCRSATSFKQPRFLFADDESETPDMSITWGPFLPEPFKTNGPHVIDVGHFDLTHCRQVMVLARSTDKLQSIAKWVLFNEAGDIISKVTESDVDLSDRYIHNVSSLRASMSVMLDARLFIVDQLEPRRGGRLRVFDVSDGVHLVSTHSFNNFLPPSKTRRLGMPGCLCLPTQKGVWLLNPDTMRTLKTAEELVLEKTRDDLLPPSAESSEEAKETMEDDVYRLSAMYNSSDEDEETPCSLPIAQPYFIEEGDFEDSFNVLLVQTVTAGGESGQDGFSVTHITDLVITVDYLVVWVKIFRCADGSSYYQKMVQVELCGWVTEAFTLDGNRGILLTAGIFRRGSGYVREDLYWFGEGGHLKGFLPLLGDGPHSFCTAYLLPQSESTVPAEVQRGLYVFFADGHGAICSVRLGD